MKKCRKMAIFLTMVLCLTFGDFVTAFAAQGDPNLDSGQTSTGIKQIKAFRSAATNLICLHL